MDKKKLDELSSDHEKWDNRELGASEEHLAFVSDEEDKEIDESLGMQSISIRLNRGLIEQFKELAKLDSVGYQPLMRQVLADYAKQNEHRLVTLLTAGEATERADKLFAQALTLRAQIPDLEPLSNERIFAEGDYNKALLESNSLFCLAYEKADPVLKRHVRLRMDQIGEILQQELQADHDKKYGKRQAG